MPSYVMRPSKVTATSATPKNAPRALYTAVHPPAFTECAWTIKWSPSINKKICVAVKIGKEE